MYPIPIILERLVRERIFTEDFRKLRLWLNMIEIGYMNQFFRLPLNCLYNLWMAVAKIADCKTCNKIQIFLAVRIPYLTALALCNGNGKTVIGVGNVFIG